MNEKVRFPFRPVAGTIAALAITAGFGYGALETDTDTPSYSESLASQGLTTEIFNATNSVVSDVSKARHSLEYIPPNTNCNVRAFDVSLGGCDPEKFPDITSALESLDEAETKLETAKNASGIEVASQVEASVKQKDASFAENPFSQPITNATYSAERLALHDLEAELKTASDEANRKSNQAHDDSQGPLLTNLLATLSFFGIMGSVASGGYTTYEIKQWLKREKSPPKIQ